MIVDFKTIDIEDRPVLVLKTPSGKVLQTLGFAHNLECQFKFAETSQITFEVPAYVNGEATPGYDRIVGEMIIDMVGWGQFVLQNPAIEKDGIKEIKSCTAYSLEYELTHKQLTLEEGTYNFWNPAAPNGTLLGIIAECCPGWKIGHVDSTLVGKYRTFDTQTENVYNIMMNGLQKPFKCVFYFDTYKKTINALDANNDVATTPIYLSLDNLIKKIDVDEKSENLVTVLDVNGADGVDIRSVNPLGGNKIYNLDYFMNTTHFDQDVIDAWEDWKKLYDARKQEYFALSVRRAMKTSEILTLEARKTDEEGVLTTYESEQAVNVQASANGDETGEIARKLVELKKSVEDQTAKIAATQNEIDDLNADNDEIVEDLKAIIAEVSFENNFTENQLKQLQHYFIENSLTEASFVINDTNAFVDSSTTVSDKDVEVVIEDCSLMKLNPRDGVDEQLYSFQNGDLSISYNDGSGNDYLITCEVSRGSAERHDTKLVVTARLGAGQIENTTNGNTIDFTGGTFTIVGTNKYIEDDTAPDEDTPNVLYTGKTLVCSAGNADMYITQETTMMEQYAIEWDLYEYAEEELKKAAWPTYTFKIDTSNFLALADFASFASHLTLGRRNYVDLGDKVLKPILVEVDLSFGDLTDFSLQFSDTYKGSDNAFNLVDLLEQSVSMGHKLDTSKFSYNDYINSGAKTAVRNFITSALDASRNAVINGSNQSITMDGTGLHLRSPDGTGGFEDEQIWMINNNIVFTDDGWETAKMAIGRFHDENSGDSWGIVAPNIVGTLIAGENMVIESPKTSIEGGPASASLFRVDENGASLYNSRIEIINPLTPKSDGTARFGDIVLDPDLGIGLGTYEREYAASHSSGDRIEGLVQIENDGTKKWNVDDTSGTSVEEGRVKFWVDMEGNLHFKGTLEGADGTFTGSLKIGDPDGEKTGVPKGVYLDGEGNLAIGGIYSPEDDTMGHDPKANFYVDNLGNMYAKKGKIEGDMYVNDLFFKDPEVDDWASILDDHNKIKSRYLDLGNIILDGETGDVKIAGNIDLGTATSINFGTFTPGIEYEYSSDGENWHKSKQTTDIYWRSTTVNPGVDGDGNPIKIRTPGPTQDLPKDWPSYIQQTHIDMTQAASPSILGNNMYAQSFNVVPGFTQGPSGAVIPDATLGTMGAMDGYDGSNNTTGTGFFRDNNHYLIVTNVGIRMQSGAVNTINSGSVCAMSNRTYMIQGNQSGAAAVVDVANANSESGRHYSAAMYYGPSIITAISGVEVCSDFAEMKHKILDIGYASVKLDNSTASLKTEYGKAECVGPRADLVSTSGEVNITGKSNVNITSATSLVVKAWGIDATTQRAAELKTGGVHRAYWVAEDGTENIRFSGGELGAWVQYDTTKLFKATSSGVRMQYNALTGVECSNSGISMDTSGNTSMASTGTTGIVSDGDMTLNSYGTFEIRKSNQSKFVIGVDQGLHFVDLKVDNYTKLKLRSDEITMQYTDDRYITANQSNCRMQYDDDIYIKLSASGINMWAGDYQAWVSINSPGFGSTSDRRVKHDIRYDVDEDIVDRLKPAKFKFNGTESDTYGFIAQDVLPVVPEAVEPVPDRDDLLGLQYMQFIPILTAKIQKQTKQIQKLEQRISRLETNVR